MSNELFQFAVENGIIDVEEITATFAMMKNQELLAKHEFAIWEGKNNNWYTYLPDNDKGRVLKKRTTRAAIEEVIITYFRDIEENPTLSELFQHWIDNKLGYAEISQSTALRYEADFKRFFVGTDISQRKIRAIDENELEHFIRWSIREHELTAKGFSKLRLLILGMFKYAKKHKMTIIPSISHFFDDLDISHKAFRQVVKSPHEQVFTQDEVQIIVDYVYTHPTLYNLGVLLAFQTGLRVGELAALKSIDWHDQILRVQRTEIRYKDDEGVYRYDVREFTKTAAGMRDVILMDDAIKTLELITQLNPNGEFLFEKQLGKRVRAFSFAKRIKTMLKNLGIDYRSIHKARKTYGTMLIDGGCDESLILSQMGHNDISTTKTFYYFNNKHQEQMIGQIQQAYQKSM